MSRMRSGHRFMAGFISGAILAAGATAAAQLAFRPMGRINGLPPGQEAYVFCTNPAGTEARQGAMATTTQAGLGGGVATPIVGLRLSCPP